MIGQEQTEFIPTISDSVSLSDKFNRAEPFCGRLSFWLRDVTSPDALTLDTDDGGSIYIGYDPKLLLYTEELEYDNSED